jgi:hypothetical protein
MNELIWGYPVWSWALGAALLMLGMIHSCIDANARKAEERARSERRTGEGGGEEAQGENSNDGRSPHSA